MLLAVTASVILAGGVAWGIYSYIAAAPERAQRAFDEAERFMGPGDYAKAIDGYTRALRISPTMVSAHVGRGLAYHAAGNDDKALADLDQALQLDPNLAHAYAVRGAIYRSRGHIQQAIDEYAKSIQAQPNVNAYFERGQLYESLGQHAKAIADYDQAVAYLREAPHVYRARAFAKANLGDEEGAKADREMARSIERH